MCNFFIVGVGRSGTSLIQSMLAAHPDVSFAPETAFIRRYVVKGVVTKKCVKSGIGDAANVLMSDDYFQRTKLDAGRLLRHVSMAGRMTDGAVYRDMLAEVARSEAKSKSGDKDPRSVEFLRLVQSLFSDIHVVHIIRDPRDVLASKKKAAWSSGHGSLRHIFANRVQLRMGRSHGPILFGERYHELLYESLLENPERELRRLCDRLGLSYEASMLDFQESAKRLISEKEIAWKKETLGPLLRDNHGKWESALCDWEIALTELVCGAAFEVGCYEKSGLIKELNLSKRICVHVAAAVIQLVDPIYRLYRRWIVWRARGYV